LSPFQITPAHGNHENHWVTLIIKKLVTDSYQNLEGFYGLLSLQLKQLSIKGSCIAQLWICLRDKI
jgi:hypothetical protein